VILAQLLAWIPAMWGRENMNNQVKDLQRYWSSPASGAYCIYADSLGNYYESIAGNLQWLGDEGAKAATTIDDLQLAFASLGWEHISNIAAQLQAYNEAAASLSHAVGDPLNALADTISALTNLLIHSWKSAAAKTQATLSITQKVIDNAPDFADNTHDAKQPHRTPPTPGAATDGNQQLKQRQTARLSRPAAMGRSRRAA
jgi:hypothetical protein